MRHDWVFDVLSDLLAYAKENGLPGLAARVTEALDEARRELAARDAPEDPPQAPPSPDRRMH